MFINREEFNYTEFLNKNDLMEKDGNLVDKKSSQIITTKNEFLKFYNKYNW